MNALNQVESINNKKLSLDKIGIVYNSKHKNAKDVVKKLENILKEFNLCFSTQEFCPEKHKIYTKLEKDISFAIVVGGDGTFLTAARFYAEFEIPVFGVNIGRLGFLAQLNPDNLKIGIQKIIEGKFKVEERLMIKACNNSSYSTALNDIVIKNGEISRSAQLFLDINDRHVCDYVADGLIISTPTGSTAYTLSAGGPVVVPELEAIVIVPICPHALTTRPIVVPAEEKLSVKIKTGSDSVYLTADGQVNVKLNIEDEISIIQNEHKAKLILLEKENNGFYSILREKLHWGISPVKDN